MRIPVICTVAIVHLCLLPKSFVRSLQLDRHRSSVHQAPRNDDDAPRSRQSTRRRFRNFDDETDEGQTARKSLPQSLLSQIFKSLHGRARKKLGDGLLLDLYGAYGSAIASPEELHSQRKKLRKVEKAKTVPVTSVEELRTAVLDRGVELKDVELQETTVRSAVEEGLISHEVLDLIVQRFESGSRPSNRDPSDTARLALSIEGGGMRGAVSAGMAAAIACLGLCDTFDAIYGSSAGSVIGAYMVSRQMCMDVYTDVLPAAKRTFVSKGRMFASLAKNLADVLLSRTVATQKLHVTPGMNISFVLDGIMCPHAGLRPLDLDAFRINDAIQPLRIVSSTVRKGKMKTICFGSKEKDFFDEFNDETGLVGNFATTSADGKRHGLFACLEASMSVPGAAGPPLPLIRSRDAAANIVSSCFDAFCYEPIPYRSAVEEGATHVLILRTRPEGFKIKTKPGVYERAVAPLYFRAHGQSEVAEYFEQGGQQYVYAEDIMTLDEARRPSTEGVPVPPPQILHGSPEEQKFSVKRLRDRSKWKKAHLLPVVVPRETPELASLEQGEEEVLQAVRGGFAAAYNLLAPAVGLKIEGLDGKRVAELVFPELNSTDSVLKEPREVRGEPIVRCDIETEGILRKKKRFQRWLRSGDVLPSREEGSFPDDTNSGYRSCPRRDSRKLLAFLPGIQSGALAPLAEGLLHHKHKAH